MKFYTSDNVPYQLDEEDALRYVGIPLHATSQGYITIGRHHWPGETYLHRDVMRAGPDQQVDHITGDKRDNRRCNLRFCTQQENTYNATTRKDNRSGIRGVYWDSKRRLWAVQITANKKTKYVGRFCALAEAIAAREAAELLLHGDFAAINGVLK